MKQCTKCKQTKIFTEFCKKSKSKDGYQPACKKCMAISYNNSREKNRDRYLQVAKRRRDQIQEQVTAWKEDRGCSLCEETYGPCLELHHIDPHTKEDNPSNLSTKSFAAFLEEASKCTILCANCHRKVHGGLFKI